MNYTRLACSLTLLLSWLTLGCDSQSNPPSVHKAAPKTKTNTVAVPKDLATPPTNTAAASTNTATAPKNTAPKNTAPKKGATKKAAPKNEALKIVNAAGAKEFPAALVFEDPQHAFVQLTSQVWGIPDKSFIQFRPDGTYRWKVTPDIGMECPVGVEKFDREGKFTFRWQKDHGLIGMENGDVYAVAFRGKQFFFRGYLLPGARKVEHSRELLGRSHKGLEAFKSPPLIEKLARHGWRKSDRFNLFMYPTKVKFDTYGRYQAEFRDGECESGGYWSVVDGGTRMLTTSDPNHCDQRGNRTANIASSSERPLFKYDMLIFFGTAFLPEKHDKNEFAFTFDSYSATVRVTCVYRGPLEKGKPKQVTFYFDNVNSYAMRLSKLTITHQAYKVVNADPMQNKNPVVTLLELPLKDVSLASGEGHTQTVEITPTIGGDVQLAFRFDYVSQSQEYHGNASNFGTIAK